VIYLAAPYSTGLSPEVPASEAMAARAARINRAAARLMLAGAPVYSPISHGVSIEPHLPEQAAADHDLWMGHCYQMLRHARELWVLQLPGWRKSRGVQLEIAQARTLMIPVVMVGEDAPILA
jgi:hypothetical protein